MIYYFISTKNFDQKILYPRIPLSKALHENCTVPRVCVSSSLIGCINAIDNVKNKRFYVHSCNLSDIEVIDPQGVGDAYLTGEKWAIVPVKMYKEYILHLTIEPINDCYSKFIYRDKNDFYTFTLINFDFRRYYKTHKYNKKY